jgi:thymidylate synthase (FAD)
MHPKVYVLSRPRFEEAYDDFLNDFLPSNERAWRKDQVSTPAERLVEFAGRTCYMSFGSRQSPLTNADYIKKLIHNEHHSVLEHAVWTILLSGISRSFTHQLVRHRVGFSYSQLSQQYHDESDARFVRPENLDQFPAIAQVWAEAVKGSQSAYRRILAELNESAEASANRRESIRAMRSAARSVLPNATETAIVVTLNARSCRHFLATRGNIIGDLEMRCVSAAILEAVRPDGPALFFDFSVEYPPDGLPLVVQRAIQAGSN